MSRVLEHLGRDVADALGDGPSSERRAAQRARVVRATGSPARGRRRARRAMVALAAAAASVLAVVAVWVLRERASAPGAPLGVTVDGAPVGAGAWLQAAGERPMELLFSTGSRVVVRPGGHVRLGQVRDDAVEIHIEDGSIHAFVSHRPGQTWTFAAGPYRIRVVGTTVTVDWDTAARRLVADVIDGRVVVYGSGLSRDGLPVASGERIDVDGRTGTAVLSRIDAPGRARPATPGDGERARPTATRAPPTASPPPARDAGAIADGSCPSAAAGPPQPVLRRPEPQPSPPGRARPPGWKELAEAGDYASAVRVAEAGGFDDVVDEADGWDLMLLGDAARFTGNVGRARQAFLAVRSRFPGTEQARSAAFRLGRVAFDQENDYADAARWFAAVLEEGDAGPLAAEARGRLMHAFVRAGDGARARQAAAEYLRSHPDGDYAPLARSLLEDAPLQP